MKFDAFRYVILTALPLVMSFVGCSGSQPAMPIVRAIPASQPIVAAQTPKLPDLLLHLPGIGGARSLDRGMARGFQQGGFTGEVQIYDWTGDDAGLKSLLQIDRNKRKARIIAQKVTARFDSDPTAKIMLTCHSGGAGIAVWTLEDLPPRVKIDTWLMLAPALSPRYDLSRALSHVAGRAYVFSSLEDPVLGFGCRMLGTIDGVNTDAAGRVGFTQPPEADAVQYEKLTPMPYRSAWVYLDNYGDHVGPMMHRFARLALAPLVLTGRMPSTQPINTTTPASH